MYAVGSRGESSYEIADLGQGAFTYALLEGLRSQTIVKDLESHLARRVPELHQRSGKVRKQVPLLIPEPGWKYDQPIFNHYATEKDILQLKEMAIDAESDGDLDRALQFWEQVNLSAMKTEDRRRSLNRINNLRNRLNVIVKPTITFNTINNPEVPPSKASFGALKSETKPIIHNNIYTYEVPPSKAAVYTQVRVEEGSTPKRWIQIVSNP